MEPLIWMGMGAAGVVALILCRLAAKHGWAWVEARVKAKAAAVEADAKAKLASVTAPIETRVTAIETDLKAIKAKVGL